MSNGKSHNPYKCATVCYGATVENNTVVVPFTSSDKASLKKTIGVLRADEFQHEVVRALCAGFPCP